MRFVPRLKTIILLLTIPFIVLIFLCISSNKLEKDKSNSDKEVKERFREHFFNVIASDNLPLDRPIPDFRSRNCPRTFRENELPDTSVIIVFHNEANSTLLRTLVSVCNRTPRRLLKEIILINDKSADWEHLKKESILHFTESLPVEVKLFECSARQGLMRARMIGAEMATGQTLTFLDSHVEVGDGWLQPMLEEIVKNRSSVICPVLSTIDENTFDIISGSIDNWGGFNGLLSFRWYTIPRKTIPSVDNKIWSPAMAGGIFSIDKEFFFALGGYDKEMNVWGFENTEMSLRVWMCGGQIIFHQCSHVAHVFRKQSPYSYPGGIIRVLNGNLRRTVDVWLDEYAEILYKVKPELPYAITGKALEERKSLRNRLQCKSFKWYLKNIYPESPFPIDCQFYGLIANKATGECLCSSNAEKEENSRLYLQQCRKQIEYMVTITGDSRLKIGLHCIVSTRRSSSLELCAGFEAKDNQKWEYRKETNMLYNVRSHLCLTSGLKLDNCDENDKTMKWTLRKLFSTNF